MKTGKNNPAIFNLVLGVLLISLTLVACGNNNVPPTTNSGAVNLVEGLDASRLKATLTGSGSSFAAPAYRVWELSFHQTAPEVLVNYAPLGSGKGRSDFLEGKTDFGGSDVQIKTEEAQGKKSLSEIIQLPVALGGIVLAFNIPGVSDLNFTSDIICEIYTGKITNWNDLRIKAENTTANLPDAEISLAVRSDRSGTTEVFTEYLSAICPDFKKSIGVSGLPQWEKAGIKQVNALSQNAGVAGYVKLGINTLGYIELSYALELSLAYASVKNPAGKFVKASMDNITAAAVNIKDNQSLTLDLLNQPGDETYPITAATYILLNRNYPDKATGRAIVGFVHYILHQGQSDIKRYNYAGLPATTLTAAQARLKLVNAAGETVLK